MSILKFIGLIPYSRIDDNDAINMAMPLLNELRHENFCNAERLLSGLDAQSRELMIYGFSTDHKALLLSTKWKDSNPDCAWSHILLGASYINIAWEIRGGSYAENVSESAWTPFLENLQGAEVSLYKAAELDTTLAEPYSWLLHTLLSQGETINKLEKVFNKAVSKDPLHYPSYYKFHTAVTDKWEGSNEIMFSFSRETSKKLDNGNILHGLVARSYSEYILSLLDSRTVNAVLSMMKRPQYANEVSNAFYKWLNATPQNLSEKLQSINDPMGKEMLNHFAMSLYATGADAEARLAFKALKGEIQSRPWAWLAQSNKEESCVAYVFDRAYKTLGLKW